jgi:hypothetical protein
MQCRSWGLQWHLERAGFSVLLIATAEFRSGGNLEDFLRSTPT